MWTGKDALDGESPPPTSAFETYLSQADFCRHYLVAPRTAERWRITGDGPPWIRAGRRRIIYRLSDCERWAESRRFAHRADELSRTDPKAM
jgi:hypothetical protein